MWSYKFSLISLFTNKLALRFQKISSKQKNLEDIRNLVQKMLHNKGPAAFLYGTSGVDISELVFRKKEVEYCLIVQTVVHLQFLQPKLQVSVQFQ